MSIALSFFVAPTWDNIKHVMDRTSQTLREMDLNPEMVEASYMCVSELAENAVKYGATYSGRREMAVHVERTSDCVVIHVTNGISSVDDLQIVRQLIDKIRSSDNHQSLYTERLLEILNDPSSGPSQLGLLRIAYEGEFEMGYEIGNESFTVTAIRRVQ